MHTDTIAAIGIDDQGRLWVKPDTATFPYIYREAMEVNWDAEHHYLYGPKPREWSHFDWYKQIISAARNRGTDLRVGPATQWIEIDTDLRLAIMSEAGTGHDTVDT